jgi:N-methylhydantoinase A
MQNNYVLGVSVGESFAEFCLLYQSQPVSQKRIFLARENLKQNLIQFLAENQDFKPIRAFVSIKVPTKLFELQLNNSICHIVTEGLEDWLSSHSEGANLPTNKNLIFSISERILADGSVHTPLQVMDLESISKKIQLAGSKKICLHFLNSNTNPIHLKQAKNFLTEKGFEIFGSETNMGTSEVRRWNKNYFSAIISSVFIERQKEVCQALGDQLESSQIHFLSSDDALIRSEKSQEIYTQFSASSAMGLTWGLPQNADLLYLGLEKFQLISSSNWTENWNSAWGNVHIPHLRTFDLKTQPTSGIFSNTFGRLDFASQQEGWEPGPIFLGRGQKLTLIDLWSESGKINKIEGLKDQISLSGVQRFKSTFLAQTKTFKGETNDISQSIKSMQSLGLQKIAIEAILQREKKKLILMGPLAPVFANVFKKDPYTVVEMNDFCESRAVGLHGAKLLGGDL